MTFAFLLFQTLVREATWDWKPPASIGVPTARYFSFLATETNLAFRRLRLLQHLLQDLRDGPDLIVV